MLSTLRKFSSSVYSKIFLFIVAIPFVFWGMGPLFTGGNLNVVAQIGKNKVATQEFANYLQMRVSDDENLNLNKIEKYLSNFIGEKLIYEEIENYGIKLSDKSLSSIIKNDKMFKKNNKFSRIEYEKFLVKNSLNAITLEKNILNQEKKSQLLNFVGGGIVPSKFLVNMFYNKINQKRKIEIINLNKVFLKKKNFTDDQIQEYFNNNKEKYQDEKRTVRFIKLSPKNLTGNDEFNNVYFKKIDEIDDLIVEGRNLDFIIKEYELKLPSVVILDKKDIKANIEDSNNFPNTLIDKVFNINLTEKIVLIEEKDQFFILDLIKNENVQKKISNQSVKKDVISKLQQNNKRKFISKIIDRINKNTFKKNDFDKFSSEENVLVEKLTLKSQSDNKSLNQEIINQIYIYPEKKVIVVADIGLTESFLVYIDKVERANIDEKSEEYNKYFNLSKNRMIKSLYSTYDNYLENKYDININYKALDNISR